MEEKEKVVSQNKPAGVVIPQSIVESSREKKKARRTMRQLPIYRDASNLKYMVVQLYKITPQRLTKYIDSILNTVSEAKKCIGLSEGTRIPDNREEYLNVARILLEDAQDDLTILRQLGVLPKTTEKSMKSLAKSVIAQAVAWRDYTNTQGANSNEV